LKDFAVKNVRPNLSGGSQATVDLEGELSANMSGGSQPAPRPDAANGAGFGGLDSEFDARFGWSDGRRRARGGRRPPQRRS
jgi:hypothetical protein